MRIGSLMLRTGINIAIILVVIFFSYWTAKDNTEAYNTAKWEKSVHNVGSPGHPMFVQYGTKAGLGVVRVVPIETAK